MSFHPGVVAGFPRPYIAPPQAGAAVWSDVKLLVSAEGMATGSIGAYGNIADAPVICTRGAGGHAVVVAASPFAGGKAFQMLNASQRLGLRVSGSAASLETALFTLEGWAYAMQWSSTAVPKPIVSAYLGTGMNSWGLRYNYTGATMQFRYFDSGGVEQTVPFAVPPALTWFHWCIERDASGFVRVYIDGTMVVKVSASSFLSSTRKHWWIGTTASGGLSDDVFDGYLAEIRLTKAALYATDAGFAPPSAAFPRGAAGLGDPHWTNVRYLSQDHTDDTASFSGSFGQLPSLSNNQATLINATAATFSTADQRAARVGDWLLGGSGFDTRTVTGTEADVFNFYDRTVPFAAEGFIRPDSASLTGTKTVLGVWAGLAKRQWQIVLNVARPTIHLSTDGSAHTEAIGTATLVAGTWYHLVLTRNVSAVYRLYVNGAVAATITSLTGTNLFNIASGSVELVIGSIAAQRSFMGHMHGVRVTHGVDRYVDTDNFLGDWPETVAQFPDYPAVAA